MLVPALVLIAAALALGAAGVLARVHRLPRNRVIGVRTRWTMSSVDAFRRANRAAAPAYLGAGAIGLAAGLAAPAAPSTAAGVTLLVVGAVGLLGLTSLAGVVGMRYAEIDRAEARLAAPTPCSASSTPAAPEQPAAGEEPPTAGHEPGSGSVCGGSCALCPRAGATPGGAEQGAARMRRS